MQKLIRKAFFKNYIMVFKRVDFQWILLIFSPFCFVTGAILEALILFQVLTGFERLNR